ncbi:MAG: polysaccharide deacetylase family protein [Sphingobacteriales bacterium]|nr:MAG: polysaccharide deacetylase family protein [Sphingobacteriales bacterium]
MKFNYFLVFALLLLAHVIAGVVYSGYAWWWVLVTVFALLAILVQACRKIQWNFFLTSTNRVPLSLQQLRTNTKPVALTFDDGPHENTLKVLDILKAEGIPATFFVIGKEIAGKEHILQRIKAEGHLIGNHTYAHNAAFYGQSARLMAADIAQCNELIRQSTGVSPNIFRPPFGVTNPNLAKALRQLGLQSVGWTLRSMDTIAKDPQALLDKILKNVRSNNTILLHDRCDITVAILPGLITRLKEKGLTFGFPVVME